MRERETEREGERERERKREVRAKPSNLNLLTRSAGTYLHSGAAINADEVPESPAPHGEAAAEESHESPAPHGEAAAVVRGGFLDAALPAGGGKPRTLW